MLNLANKIDREAVWQEPGTVVERRGGELVVRVGATSISAARAVSCLVEPEVDDYVLVSQAGDEWFVLAVLRRESDAPVKLSVDGDLRVDLDDGAFEVTASDGVKLISPEDVSVVAGRVDVHSAAGRIAIGSLTMLGALLESRLDQLKVVVGGVDAVVERVVQRVKRSYRFVEETDQLKAEHIDYVANKSMNLQAENALVTAQELVKIDGSQIHVG